MTMPDAQSPMIETWRQVRRILCVRLDSMGDVLMTTPAIRALAQSIPDHRLTLLTSPAGAEAGRLLSSIEKVLVYDAPWMKLPAPRLGSRYDWGMIETVKAQRFDAAVIFTVYSQSALPAALLSYLADIPLRLAHCRENPYHLLTDWVRDPEPDSCIRHEVRRQLDLVAAVGASVSDDHLSIHVSDSAAARIDRRLKDMVPPGHPWIVIHPGASAASRRYPQESFAEAARQLVHTIGCRILWTGNAREREEIVTIQRAMRLPSSSLAGQLSLEEFGALLARAPLLLSNNTGAVHLAAAVGTPVVDLYALTNPQHTPWRIPRRLLFQDVACRFCYRSACPEDHHRCLDAVMPETIVTAVRELLAETQHASEKKRLPVTHIKIGAPA
jgi:lipopolysaccharide heptosyltransferase II